MKVLFLLSGVFSEEVARTVLGQAGVKVEDISPRKHPETKQPTAQTVITVSGGQLLIEFGQIAAALMCILRVKVEVYGEEEPLE